MEDGVDDKTQNNDILQSTSTTNDDRLSQEQEDRSFLRERFLHFLKGIQGKRTHFKMYEKTEVDATFQLSDIDGQNFLVSDLETPMGTQPQAMLRCADIISCSVDIGTGEHKM
ncbi:PREDICTED: gem-associated protein 7-like [Branchiostoma belcheri]|uniref:Gem-associated protein 7-like n=1 Tax=Branchiostoma belcheri TaxID=7741 RepID=A0A6P4ZPI8_BRABE|nr:PREDICTED: gem-associated protein 7-like [Branchiostoma belcheri]